MKNSKFLRGPLIWILLVGAIILIGSNLVSGTTAPSKVPTSDAVAAINDNRVSQATLVDREQII